MSHTVNQSDWTVRTQKLFLKRAQNTLKTIISKRWSQWNLLGRQNKIRKHGKCLSEDFGNFPFYCRYILGFLNLLAPLSKILVLHDKIITYIIYMRVCACMCTRTCHWFSISVLPSWNHMIKTFSCLGDFCLQTACRHTSWKMLSRKRKGEKGSEGNYGQGKAEFQLGLNSNCFLIGSMLIHRLLLATKCD